MALLPEKLLRYSVVNGRAIPHFLLVHDAPWLRELLTIYRNLEGMPWPTLEKRLQAPSSQYTAKGKRAMAMRVLEKLGSSKRRITSPVPPRQLRSALFMQANRYSLSRESTISTIAAQYGLSPEDLMEYLFADLSPEQRVGQLPEEISERELALRVNLALAQGIIYRATSVQIQALGHARALINQAKLGGLICMVKGSHASLREIGEVEIHISGPLALFRRTLMYGHALSRVVPLLAWCTRYQLRAECLLRETPLTLQLQTGDPIFPSQPPRLFDSRIERQFARDFMRLTSDWEVIREPEPLATQGTLIFPDFILQHRRHPRRRWLLEIAGFWTPEYLQKKLAHLVAAKPANFLLCIDEKLNCTDERIPDTIPVLRFQKKVDASAVLQLIENEN